MCVRPRVGVAGEHLPPFRTDTSLLRGLLVWSQLLNVSADVRAGFTTLRRCVRTVEGHGKGESEIDRVHT